MKTLRFFLSLGLAALVALTAFAKDAKPKKPKATDAEKARWETEVKSFFEGTNVLTIDIQIPPAGIKALEAYQWQWNQKEVTRPTALATIKEGGHTYTNVDIHLKGSAGSFRSINDNPAMTLTFSKESKLQRFHGLDKLSLNNSVQDSTLVSEKLCREVFLTAGIPTPRAGHALVTLNGRKLGMYVLLEGFNKAFVARHFKNTSGNLYDGGFVKDINAHYDTNSGDHPEDQSDLKALLAAVGEKDLAKRRTALGKSLDVDRFLTYLALDVMLWNWDGYAMNKNNYRIFSDKDSGRLIFMPHGLDQMFWKPDGPILPSMQGMVARSVLEVPEYRAAYLDKIRQLRKTVFTAEKLTNRVNQITAFLQPALRSHEASAADNQKSDVENYVTQIASRVKNIDRQLASMDNRINFGTNGQVNLVGWESRKVFSNPALEQTRSGEKALLRSAANGSTIGLWRTSAWLEEGKYVLQGRVKTTGIKGDPGDSHPGVSLHVAGQRAPKPLLGDADWNDFKFEFSVSDPMAEVEFVAELRASAGEALFDQSSLQLLKR